VVPALLSTELARTLFCTSTSKQAVGSLLSVATQLLTWYLRSRLDGLLPEEHSSRTCLTKMARPQSHFFIVSQHSYVLDGSKREKTATSRQRRAAGICPAREANKDKNGEQLAA
jgi:hypothetical protein